MSLLFYVVSDFVTGISSIMLFNDSFKWKQSFLSTWSVSVQWRAIVGWHVKDLGLASRLGIGKKRKSLSVDILWAPSAFPRRMGPSLACPDVRIFGDIRSISDSHWCQIPHPPISSGMAQQTHFSSLRSSPLLRSGNPRKVFAKHFLQSFRCVCLWVSCKFAHFGKKH